jgi:rhodanese-related sulfurtransferase
MGTITMTPLAITDLSVREVQDGLADGSMLLVDVREPQELASGMIPGSIAMPLSRFDPSAIPEAAGRRVVFTCAAGIRSRIAIEAARRAGLDVSEHLAAGYKGWVAAGGDVIMPDD